MFDSSVRHPALHPGQSARIEKNQRTIGWLGALHPEVERGFELTGRGLVFELAVDALRSGSVPSFAPVSRFPAIRRDLALVVDEAVSAEAVCDGIRAAAGGLLANLQLFDVYRGKGVDSGRKSLALGLTLQDQSRTLKDTEVEEILDRVLARLRQDHGAALRD